MHDFKELEIKDKFLWSQPQLIEVLSEHTASGSAGTAVENSASTVGAFGS